jgi:hypothetical protein
MEDNPTGQFEVVFFYRALFCFNPATGYRSKVNAARAFPEACDEVYS